MEYKNFNDEEIAKYLEMLGMKQSAERFKSKSIDKNYINVEDIEYSNVISEYEDLSDKMKAKVKKLIVSLRESNDRDEKDTLDEKDGKEELDIDKKKKVEERKRDTGDNEEIGRNEENNEDIEEKDSRKTKEDEAPKKDEYLAELKRLHEMKMVDLKYQLKTGEADVDRYYMSIIALQKRLNRQRAAYIKEYGSEELIHIENEYLKEENKYKRTIINNMEASLAKLRALDEKLDAILAEMNDLQQYLEDESISKEYYDERINALEKDKLDVLWQINQLNPELLEEVQENQQFRWEFERKITPTFLAKEKAKEMSALNKARTAGIEHDEKKQEGEAEKSNDDRKKEYEEAVRKIDERLYEIKKEIEGLDMNKPADRQRAGELIDEYKSLSESKIALEKQMEDLEKNMKKGIEDYGDLKGPETEREESMNEYNQNTKNVNYAEQTPEFMDQYRDAIVPEPLNYEQAREQLDNLNNISEEAKEEQIEEPVEEGNERTLTRKKYGFNS